MVYSFEKYVSEAFGMYLRDRGTSLERIAKGCIRPGAEFKDCESEFRDKLSDIASDFQDVIGDYMGDDVVMAVLNDCLFEDAIDVDSMFSDDWIALNSKPRTPAKKQKPVRKTSQKPKSVSRSSKPKASKPRSTGKSNSSRRR